jgi:hypothetical protein
MVLALVLGLHLLLLVVSVRSRPEPPAREAQSMVLLDLPPVLDQPQPSPRTVPATRSTKPAQPQRSEPAESAPAAITLTPTQPGTDWRHEAQTEVEAQAAEAIKRQRRECDEARQHGKYPPGCPKASYDPHWQPQEKSAGFIGIVPYVRLGKRCIVVLSFFSCNLDAKLPDADGTLLKDVSDPSRPASSVPELGPAFPEAPKAQAFKPQ